MTLRNRRQTVFVWGRQMVRARLQVLIRELRRLDRDPGEDPIHDTRVAGRRLRAALRHLESCFAPLAAGRLRQETAQVARLLGEIRDLDILLSNLARDARRPGSPMAALVARLRIRRGGLLRRVLPVARRLAGRLPAWRKKLGDG